MTIRVNLDVMLARRKMKLGQLSDIVGISLQNLSVLKTEKARATNRRVEFHIVNEEEESSPPAP